VTEAEWLASESPEALLGRCWGGASARKKRLFGCACCYRLWDRLPDPRCRTAVRVAERFADGASPADALATARHAAMSIIGRYAHVERRNPHIDDERELYSGTAACSNVASDDPDHSRWAWKDVAETLLEAGSRWHVELAATCVLLRCVFGNPFRPATLDPAWLTSDVLLLARGIYEEKAFDRMPILADALQDAGCDSEEVLTHCRGPGPHARGCWVVDLVLGKK
jgi:hypothetical protein